MKVVDSLAMRAVLWAIPVFSIVFLLLKFFSPRTRDRIYYFVIATAFIWSEVFLETSGMRSCRACSISRWARVFCGASCWV